MVKLYAPVPQRFDGIWDILYPIFFRHNDARVYEKKWDIPVYPKKILPHQEASIFWYMGDEMEYPNFNLPHRKRDAWEMIWDIPF